MRKHRAFNVDVKYMINANLERLNGFFQCLLQCFSNSHSKQWVWWKGSLTFSRKSPNIEQFCRAMDTPKLCFSILGLWWLKCCSICPVSLTWVIWSTMDYAFLHSKQTVVLAMDVIRATSRYEREHISFSKCGAVFGKIECFDFSISWRRTLCTAMCQKLKTISWSAWCRLEKWEGLGEIVLPERTWKLGQPLRNEISVATALCSPACFCLPSCVPAGGYGNTGMGSVGSWLWQQSCLQQAL